MNSPHLKIIADITPNLPELADFETSIGGPAVSLKSATGIPSFGFGVHRDKDIGIMRMFTPKDGVVDTHRHLTQHEWLGVIKGRVELIFVDNGDKVVLADNDATHIAPSRPHTVIALEDTWTWSVSMPPALGYPDVTGCPFAVRESINADRAHTITA